MATYIVTAFIGELFVSDLAHGLSETGWLAWIALRRQILRWHMALLRLPQRPMDAPRAKLMIGVRNQGHANRVGVRARTPDWTGLHLLRGQRLDKATVCFGLRLPARPVLLNRLGLLTHL